MAFDLLIRLGKIAKKLGVKFLKNAMWTLFADLKVKVDKKMRIKLQIEIRFIFLL